MAEIQRATGGNALWIVEVVHGLTDHGVVADDWETGIVEDLPDTLIDTIKTRLDGVDPQTALLVAHASVLGSVIDPQVLAELAGMPVSQVLAGLQIAEHRALVHPPDGAGHFRFAHPLIESTLYDSLDGVRCKRGHRRAGLALEQRLGDQAFSHAPVLAHHFTKAGPAYAPKAFTYSALAGQSAFGVAAYERALHHFNTALSLVHTVEQAQQDMYELQLTMGKAMATALMRGTNHPRTVELFAQVAALVEDLPVSPELLTPLAWLWAESLTRSDAAMTKHYQAKLLAAGESLPPGPDRLFALWAGVDNAALECDFEAADQWAGQCMAMIDDPDFVDSAQFMRVTGDPVSLSHITWSLMLSMRADDPQKARSVMERGESLIQRTAEPIRPTAQYAAALTRWTRHDVAEVEQIAAEGIEICDRLKLVQWRAVLQACQGWAQAMRGDPAGAARCRDGVDAWHTDGANASSNLWAAMVAEACIAVEQPQLAHRFVERAFEIQSRTHEPFHLPSLIRVKAELAVLDPDFGDPEQLYRQALALAQQQGAQILELQVALSMTQWSRDLGHQILTAAVTKIGADVDLPDIKAARALLR